MLIYQGHFPRDLEADSVISSLRGDFKYPLAYGYANVGTVQETGENVDRSWQGNWFFPFSLTLPIMFALLILDNHPFNSPLRNCLLPA